MDILKYKYLGEALVCDVLLYKKYPVTYQEYLNLKEEYHYHCVGEEWLMRDILQVLKRDCIKLGIPFKEVIYRRYYRVLMENLEKPDLIIVDALNNIDTLGTKYESIIKGDAKCYSIAAASIIAKVTRDRIMRMG